MKEITKLPECANVAIAMLDAHAALERAGEQEPDD
jgi:hypothetical protein